jgi:hypothetical protein
MIIEGLLKSERSVFKKTVAFFVLLGVFSPCSIEFVSADTVSGGGYIIEQTIVPVEGAVSGNGYTVHQASQQTSNEQSGGGYSALSVFGPLYTAPSGGGGGGGGVTYSGGGGGYYVYPTSTPWYASSTASTTPPIDNTTILTANGSSCSSRIVISQPIDIGLATNKKSDVMKLQTFLNTYENAKLPVTGYYGKADILAVKKWQEKYRSVILAPMKLRNPTGTIYTQSMRQIERQSSAKCGTEVVVTSCPYFKQYQKLGDKNAEVKKIQQFLNIVQGERLAVNGIYGETTSAAVKRFQKFTKKGLFSFVTSPFMSGNWNASTRTKANEVIGCDIIKP